MALEEIKILLTRSLLNDDKKYISDRLTNRIGNHFQIVAPVTYDENGIIKELHDADVLLGPYITERIVCNAKDLKLIQVPWAGMDTFNFLAMKGSTIPVCNSHSNAGAVAEMGVGLVLDLVKKISYHDRKMRQGNWNRDQKPMNLKSKLLCNMTACILGYGEIGSRIGKTLKAFGTKIICVTNDTAEYKDIDEIYSGSEWADAVQQADICICTLPLTDDTRNLINSDTLKNFCKDCLILNMSRAEIFNDDAVYNAIIKGEIGGFASDVWWNAPDRTGNNSFVSIKNRYEKLENVVLSPHRAGFVDGQLPHLEDAIVNIVNLHEGKPLINIVDIKKKY